MHTEDDYELDITDDEGAVDVSATPRHYVCNHRLLKARTRCLGCGRTLNEIALDGD